MLNQPQPLPSIQSLRLGDTQAFEKLYFALKKPLLLYLYSQMGRMDVCEEILQDLFSVCWKNRGVLKDGGNIKGYLFKSARNRALDYLNRKREAPLEAGQDFSLPLEKTVCGDEDGGRAEMALRKIPAEQREVIVLKIKEEFTFAEIGELLGIPEATAKSRLRLGMETLRTLLTPRGKEDDA